MKTFAYGSCIGLIIALIAFKIWIPPTNQTATEFVTSYLVISLTLVDLVFTPLIVFKIITIESKTINWLVGSVWGFGILPYLIAFHFERILPILGIKIT